MTDRDKFEAQELKERLYYERRKCEVCGKVLGWNTAQLAHRVPKHKKYIKKYGKDFIHSSDNMALVCSLECNSKVIVDPATRPLQAQGIYYDWLNSIR